MSKAVVLSGLSDRYNLTKLPSGTDKKEIESWLVMGKTVREGGSISFSNGSVSSVVEFLTETDSAETISFTRDLYAYLKPEIPPIASDAFSSKRRATVVVELEEKHFRKAGDFVETSSIKFKFKDATYDLFYSDSSLPGSSGPDVKISRTRGTESRGTE